MAKVDVHTVPHGDGWATASRGISASRTRLRRRRRRRRLAGRWRSARKAEHLVHRKDATIGKRNTYSGHDPRRTKG